MSRRYLVSQILLVDGILLIFVAFIHLFATPLIGKWLARELTPEALKNISPPFLLDHIVVGILLMPFGISTLYSAAGVRAGQSWARNIAIVNALVVLLMPLLLVVFIGPSYFSAMPFLVAAIIMTCVAISMILPLLWLRKPRQLDKYPLAEDD